MPNDERIWADYARGVKRIKKVAKTKPSATKPAVLKIPAKKNSSGLAGSPAVKGAGMTEGLLDKRTERKLRDGDIRIEARLDMHGMTQTEAHAALGDFITTQAARGARNLLVITGKGRDGSGVLKSNFKLWLENLPEASRILAVKPAAVKHGGTGAFYVMLRKAS